MSVLWKMLALQMELLATQCHRDEPDWVLRLRCFHRKMQAITSLDHPLAQLSSEASLHKIATADAASLPKHDLGEASRAVQAVHMAASRILRVITMENIVTVMEAMLQSQVLARIEMTSSLAPTLVSKTLLREVAGR